MAKDPGEIREEIEATRDALAGTIEALGEKADIKGRVTDALQDGARAAKDQLVESVSEVRSRLSSVSTDPTSGPLIGSERPPTDAPSDLRIRAAAAVAMAMLCVLLISRWGRKRRRNRA